MAKDWHDQISQPKYSILLEEDLWVEMRDGSKLAVDVYRPDTTGKFPALVSLSAFGKDTQKLPTSPDYRLSDPIMGTGGHECGEQSYYVPRGYVHVIPDIRGVGKSEGKFGPGFTDNWGKDGHDLIEWISKQSWSDGSVGMLGMSAFGAAQYEVGGERPPQLKAIFPFNALSDRYRHNYYKGGILNYRFQLFAASERPIHSLEPPKGYAEFNRDELEKRIKSLQAHPDIRCNTFLYHLTILPENNPILFDLLLHPFDGPYYAAVSAYSKFKAITMPACMGASWESQGMHLPGAFDAYENLATPQENKKLFIVPGGIGRPFYEVQDVCIRWYDHWLKDNDTGIFEEPPILIYLQGTNRWRYERQWPLPVTQWTRFYLREKGKLSTSTPTHSEEPMTFVSDPWLGGASPAGPKNTMPTRDNVPKVSYETEPLSEDMEVTGPIALYWHASIRSESIQARSWKTSGFETLEPPANDTDWFLKLKDIGIDGSERRVAEGWLKASHYEIDEDKSKPYAPYHPHTRSLPIDPNEIIQYASDMRMTSNVFQAGHRIRLEIAAQGFAGVLFHHLPHMARVTHRIFSEKEIPSYILLPVIPKGYFGEGEPDFPPQGPFRIPK